LFVFLNSYLIFALLFSLALIYEETGDLKKALEFYMIAAHILVKDVELWKRVGKLSRYATSYLIFLNSTFDSVLSRDQNLLRQSAYCYSKAVRFDPSDAEAHWERAQLYGTMGEHRRSLECMPMISVPISKHLSEFL
jgi:general transcription factor 3C polypeptide 3 (transcription factor C subunit 4)